MRTQFLAPNELRWSELLTELDHDFYHLPSYAALSAKQEGGDAVAFLAEEGNRKFFVPLIVRQIDPLLTNGMPCYDATCPYGYPGPLASPMSGSDEPFVSTAVDAFIDGMRQRGIVTAFIRMHPLFPTPHRPFARTGRLVQHGETVSVDLTLPDEEIWHQTRHNHRRGINRLRREGYSARLDDTWEHFDAFIEIYHQTMRRLSAQDYYFFTREYFIHLREVLGPRLHLTVVEIEGQVASAGLITETCGIVQYHLSGTRQEFVTASPEKLRVDFLRRWAKSRGNHVLHLGGGRGGNRDSLFAFKAGFSDQRSNYATWRAVVDQQAYDRLVGAWERRHGRPAGGMTDHFPPYRREPRPSHPLRPLDVVPQGGDCWKFVALHDLRSVVG